jgi:hypothetical protein
VKATFSLYPDKDALADLDRDVRPVHSYNPLVQIDAQTNAQIKAQIDVAAAAPQAEESRA